jgi:hypothetical protein
MPADHRLRLHDPQLASPSLRPKPPYPDQKNPVSLAQARLWLAAKEHLELVSQDQVLERKVLPGTTAINRREATSRGSPAPAREHIRAGRAAVWTILIDFCRPSVWVQTVQKTVSG